MTEVTHILSQIENGDPQAAERLLPLIYEELRKLAAHRLANEKPGQTLQATALVHDAYLRLVNVDTDIQWNSRGHFFGAAAEAMRRILVECARRKKSVRGGGKMNRVEISVVDPEAEAGQLDVLILDESLQQLAKHDPRACEVVKLRFFTGMTVPETAKSLGISVSTAENDWAYAKSWLKLHMDSSTE